jgi:sec-independent protein translocase protein TatA
MQEMIFIFVIALLIFGPKKLPELGKTLGKAMTEFRRASSELKTTFDREMSNLERETESTTKEISNNFSYDNYSYDSSYDPESHSGYDSTETNPYTASASASQGAQLNAATPEIDGSMFVSALEEGGAKQSETVPRETGPNSNGAEPKAVQG